MNILGLNFQQFTQELQQCFGKGPYYAAAIYRHVFGKGNKTFDQLPEFDQVPELGRTISRKLQLAPAPIVDLKKEAGTVKFISRLKDGLKIESVLIPMANHLSLCISSQAGCRMGCRFCQTGQMGLKRNLTVEEIVGQVFQARFALNARIRNIVFMGMGEPLDNFTAVSQAISVLSDQRGLDLAPKHITVSTVGLIDGIDKLARLNLPQLKLAVSLNAADERLRSDLMPINRNYPLSQLKKTLLAYPLQKNGTIFVEYVLIKDINDTRSHARQLALYLSGLKVKVNLIGYNPRRNSPFGAPGQDDLLRFRDYLIEHNIFVRLRVSKGRRIMAACGQLGT